MAFASIQDRVALLNASTAFETGLYSVQIVTSKAVEIELAADDAEHAMTISANWLEVMGAKQAEIFRVLADGSIKPTLGVVTSEEFLAH